MSTTGRPKRNSQSTRDISELERTDFEDCPIWEFTLHEGATVPNHGSVRPKPNLTTHDRNVGTGIFAVRTHFTYADGTKVIGYCSPIRGPLEPPEHTLGYLAPAIITRTGQVPFWLVVETPPESHDLQRLYETLGRQENVFPIIFESDVPVAKDEVGSGVIEAFTYVIYSSGRFEFVKMK